MKTQIILVSMTISTLMSGCAASYTMVQVPLDGQTSISLPPKDTTICDPFDSGGKFSDRHGILAELFYLEDTDPRYATVDQYISNGRPVESMIMYINRLFVPTRPFDRGFRTLGGDVLRLLNGDTLTEWFGIDMHTHLVLGPNDAPGNYQLAIISDDGAKLTFAQGGELIDNDGTHPTQMKCATQPVNFDTTSQHEVDIRYFQGPRTHISMILMWRPWPKNPSLVMDPQCDQVGNDYFFDSTQNPSVATQNYNDLLASGWKPMENSNFILPTGASNPCDY
jgi:hypothetical protein